MFKKICVSFAIAALLGLNVGGAADADEVGPPLGPNDLTWAQYDALLAVPDSSSYSVSSRTRAAMSCTAVVTPVYFRTSGSGYDFGSVGVKPETNCSVNMYKITNTTTMYKTVWWGFQALGTWTNMNTGTNKLTTKTIEIVCADTRSTEFVAVFTSEGVFPNGTSSGTVVSSSGRLGCGTNP